ncbi:MAG: glycoside hydrolase family 9 protein [Bacteroidales bacterium]
MTKNLIVILFILALKNSFSQETFFRINQLGYPVTETKKALLISKNVFEEKISLCKASDGTEVANCKVNPDPSTPWPPFNYYYEIDFSDFKTEGEYFLCTGQGDVKSQHFKIGNYPSYQKEILHFMRSQRCGYNPEIKQVCHTHDGLTFFGPVPDSSYLDASGGWHDAGDQLKYLITSSNATARLLLAYEWCPDKFADEVNSLGQPFPNQIPDVLDEAKWGLDWIHKLHPAPGQLYHQVADDRDHRGFKMPDNDNSDYGWGKNSYRPVYFATGKPQGAGKYKSEATGVSNIAGRSAAAMTIAYRIWKNILKDKVYADKCLQAALDLYQMGKKQEGYQQGNSYGEPYRYYEDTWADDMEWAAAELYKVTRNQQYLKDAIRFAKIINTASWMEMDSASHYQMYPFINIGHYALWEIGDAATKKMVSEYYRHNLEKIKARALKNPYQVGHIFIWCSNNLAAAVITQVILYEKMTGDRQFHFLLNTHLDWLLGRNPWGTSMITGIPENGDYPLDVHMPFWVLKKKSISGSLVDGPLWETIHGKMLGIKLNEPDEYDKFQPPHLKYWDDYADYSTNEPTMDGSADILFFMAFFSGHK